MADEEAKEDEVKQNQNVDPDEEGLPAEEEAAAPAGPAPIIKKKKLDACLLYTSPSPRDRTRSRMPSSA